MQRSSLTNLKFYRGIKQENVMDFFFTCLCSNFFLRPTEPWKAKSNTGTLILQKRNKAPILFGRVIDTARTLPGSVETKYYNTHVRTQPFRGFPGNSVVKAPKAGGLDLIPGSGN